MVGWLDWKTFERKRSWLNRRTALTFTWRGWGKPRKTCHYRRHSNRASSKYRFRALPRHQSTCVEGTIQKLERYKSPGINETSAEIIPAGTCTLRSEVQNFLIPFGMRKNYVGVLSGSKTGCSYYRGISLLVLTTWEMSSIILLSRLTRRWNYFGLIVWVPT
jgi:hypothetical protein